MILNTSLIRSVYNSIKADTNRIIPLVRHKEGKSSQAREIKQAGAHEGWFQQVYAPIIVKITICRAWTHQFTGI